MKKNLVSFKTIRKKLWNNICNLWYGIHRKTVKKLYDKMPSMVEAVRKARGGFIMYFVVKNDGVKAENDKIMF